MILWKVEQIQKWIDKTTNYETNLTTPYFPDAKNTLQFPCSANATREKKSRIVNKLKKQNYLLDPIRAQIKRYTIWHYCKRPCSRICLASATKPARSARRATPRNDAIRTRRQRHETCDSKAAPARASCKSVTNDTPGMWSPHCLWSPNRAAQKRPHSKSNNQHV